MYLPDSRLKASQGMVPGLNGLRAVSIIIVLISHLNLERYIPGGFGVSIFLFISGFLISRLLLAEYESSDRLDLPRFWARRVIRLYPPLFVMIALTVGYSLATHSEFSITAVFSSLLYFANYLRIFDQPALDSVRLVHTWSLSVEEHFYLFFPPLFLLLLKRRAHLTGFLIAACVVVLLLRISYHFAIPTLASTYIYNATETRMDFLLAGVLASVICNGPAGARYLDTICRPVAFWIAIGMILFSLLYRNDFFRDTFRYEIQLLALFVLVPSLVFRQSMAPVKKVLNSAPFDYLGKISYDLYLFHVLVLFLALQWAQSLHLHGWHTEAVGFAVGIPLSIVAAHLSYRLIERPLKPLRAKLRARPARSATPDRIMVANEAEA